MATRIDYKRIKGIPFEDVLEHYGVTLTLKNISGDQKFQGRTSALVPSFMILSLLTAMAS